MNNTSYVLEIYDTEDYTGPNPVQVTSRGIINGPENSQYLVIEPDQEIIDGQATSKMFAVRPHYGSDSINHVTDSVTTVGIALFDNGKIDIDHTYNFSDLKFWKVGKISPHKNSA